MRPISGSYRRSLRRAFTLIEIIVASILFIGVGLLVVSMLLWGLDAYGQGNLQAQANNDCRTALKAIRDELGHSSLLPIPGTSPTFPVASSVLIPNPYQLNVNDFTTADPRPTPSGAPTPSACATDVCAFVEAVNGISSLDPGSLFDQTGQPQFQIVVYYIGNTAQGTPNPTATPAPIQHQLQLDANSDVSLGFTASGRVQVPSEVPAGAPPGNTLFRFTTLLTSAEVTAEIVTENLTSGGIGWQLNTVGTLITQPPAAPASNTSAVVTLGDNDALSFVVSHAPVETGNQLQIDPTFGTAFDRHDFQVDVMVARRFDTHVGTQRFIQVHQKDSVAIRSFQP
ncbi:MAG: hypothetical protein ACYCW6_17605 [Candidatus Xenobia bacterium]